MSQDNHRVYALLVGINDYSPDVGKLRGCLNDVAHYQDWFKDSFDPQRLAVEVLTDSDATRGNIIAAFRSHLAKAGPGDTVLFQYSGHGARWKSAQAFERFFPNRMDEGLVCYDSREPGGYDLADKELAVLLAEVARRQSHVAVLLDSCHSGSGVRGADDFTQALPRYTHQRDDERALDSYLDGYYSDLLQRGESLEIPPGRQILLAACERVQKAWETRDHRGVFSTTLLDILGQTGPRISYADLFVRARAAVNRYADNQTPQFETYQGFNAYSGFLGGAASGTSRRCHVHFDNNAWKVDCGALHGLPSDPEKPVELALYRDADRETPAGHAETVSVAAQHSELNLNFAADPAEAFKAEVTSLPVPPLAVALRGDAEGVEAARNVFAVSQDGSLGFAFDEGTQGTSGADYLLEAQDGKLRLFEQGSRRFLQGLVGYKEASIAEHLFPVLKQIAAWERAVALQNPATRMDKDAVAFRFVEALGEGGEHLYPESSIVSGGQGVDEIVVDLTRDGDVWRTVTAGLRANNRSHQPLHFALAYLSDDFGVQVPYNERIEPTDDLFDLLLAGHPTFQMKLEQGEGDEATHLFKLIVSTERIDDFLLVQDPIEIGNMRSVTRGERGISFGPSKEQTKLRHENEWFTKTLRVRLVRRLNQVGDRDVVVGANHIIIKAHPKLSADVGLTALQTGSRSAGTGADFYRVLERQGMDLVNFAGTRGEAETVLELTDIQNPESVHDQPLEIELDLGLGADECVLPLTFDGEHILLAGDAEQGHDGRTLVHIDHIPEGIPDGRRSLGSALKLYFFKTYLKRNVNQLRWVEYRPDGSFERHKDGVADKVAAAKNILLLVHGIIGDTESIAAGMPEVVDGDGTALSEQFDLVLTYDYENLGTTIEDTARQLKTDLRDAGLHEDDDKRLTLLVHSMGGLVSRWFIEQEGGNQVVDHLVMCGTPNGGSPFGKIDSARNLAGVMTTWAMNSFPVFAPFGAGLLTVLGRSRKISPTLEQMHPKSAFIHALNASDDPGVRYTILAGDIRDYREQEDQLLAKLTTKIGKGALFDALYQDAGHDIAVSIDSIRDVSDVRAPVPDKSVLGCHHLSYFASEAGLAALSAVEW